jgi:phosphoglycolate phosphatase-like HAD superfamily hydrolase
MTPKLLITDLDNTLYDWVTFFAKSFRAMLDSLAGQLNVEPSALAAEFKAVHQTHGTLESPFAALELPTVIRQFPGHSRNEIAQTLKPAFEVFNVSRRQYLSLYPGVPETLHALRAAGVVVVGHTEAIAINAYYRVVVLDIVQYFQRLYALEGRVSEHPEPNRPKKLNEPPPEFLRVLPVAERKPNPAVLLDICRREGFAPEEACYIGDSVVRDISMAKEAGVRAVWARFGTEYEPGLWDTLVSVTHWTDEDVKREIQLRAQYSKVAPDVIADSFSELLPIFGLNVPVPAR